MRDHDALILRTADGERISARIDPGPRGAVRGGTEDRTALLVAHGFTGNIREERVRRVVSSLSAFAPVMSIDFRGHGHSSGESTVGMDEVLDLDVAVGHLRDVGFERVVTVGFSMGGSVALRHGAMAAARDHAPENPADAVVSISAPGFWFYRGTQVMRVVHRLVETPAGRLAMRARGVHITSTPWPDPPPLSPEQSVALMSKTPLFVVHGDRDRYFPLEHPRALERAARQSGNSEFEILIVKGFDHAETGIDDATLARIGTWALEGAGNINAEELSST